jgi:predicted RND superfamily exporter protein
VGFVADHLGPWIDEAIGEWRVEHRCAALGLRNGAGGGGDGTCAAVAGTLAELDDTEWAVPPTAALEPVRSIPTRVHITGRPILGQALARSVTDNLLQSTLVSLIALAVMLVLSRHLVALAPALWTLAVTGGVLALTQQPISIGTSMVACIALGAGVDFGIHLHVRARAIGGPKPGERAVEELGIVIAISGVTLAAAFSVLLASQMPPLRQFGAGLVVGLLGASLGAIWLLPGLIRSQRRRL